MRRNHIILLAAALFAVSAAPAAAATTYKLDAYDHDNGHYAGPVTGPTLDDGKYYVARVDGTISYYGRSMWEDPIRPFNMICGATAKKPEYATPGKTNGAVGMDAETVFARPCTSGTPNVGHWTNFEINNNAVFRNVNAIDGPYTTPSWDNAYEYPLLGHGTDVKFRLRDIPGTRDNYGQLRITVRLADPGRDCSGDRWRAFGFEDGGECWYTITTVNASNS
jgi:hypothetical protein